MARFDVYRQAGSQRYLLDCQAEVLSRLTTRFVVPLMSISDAPRPADRLNPVFVIDGQDVVMVTQFAAAILASELGTKVASLAEHDSRVMNALDMLLTGY